MTPAARRELRVLESENGAASQVPRADRWPAQVQEAFGFLEELGFRVVDSGTYRLGEWTLFGNGYAGIHI